VLRSRRFVLLITVATVDKLRLVSSIEAADVGYMFWTSWNRAQLCSCDVSRKAILYMSARRCRLGQGVTLGVTRDRAIAAELMSMRTAFASLSGNPF